MGFPETVLVESGLNDAGRLILIMQLLKLRWRDVSDRLLQSLLVVPVNPIQCRELRVVESLPMGLSSNDFGLKQPNHRFRQSVLIRVSDATDRGLDPGFGEPLRVADRQILEASASGIRLTLPSSAPRPAIGVRS